MLNKAKKILITSILMLGMNATAAFSETTHRVYPLKTQRVKVSNQSINWLRCMEGKMEDIIFSEEKGIKAWIEKDNAYVKFLHRNSPQGRVYVRETLDIYVYCAGENYKLLLEPDVRQTEGTTILLGNSDAKKAENNRSLHKAKPIEENALMMIQDAYKNDIESKGYSEDKLIENPMIFDEMQLLSIRKLSLMGMGLVLKEYQLHNPTKKDIEVRMKQIPVQWIAEEPVAMSVDPLIVKPDQKARMFVVTKAKRQIPQLFKNRK